MTTSDNRNKKTNLEQYFSYYKTMNQCLFVLPNSVDSVYRLCFSCKIEKWLCKNHMLRFQEIKTISTMLD